MPPRQDSKVNAQAWLGADHSVDQFKAFALLNGWPYGGTSKATIKASLTARVNALPAGDQVWIPPDPAAPAPGPAPAPAPVPAPAPAPRPTQPSVVDKAVKDLKNEVREGWRIALDAVWNLKIR